MKIVKIIMLGPVGQVVEIDETPNGERGLSCDRPVNSNGSAAFFIYDFDAKNDIGEPLLVFIGSDAWAASIHWGT